MVAEPAGTTCPRCEEPLEAPQAFNAAIKVDPAYEVAWNNKGNVLTRMGNDRETLACYDRALEIDAAYGGAWANKGCVLTGLGDYAAAAVCADRLIRLGRRPRPGTG